MMGERTHVGDEAEGAQKEPEALTFEAAFARLEQVVTELESGNTGLEQSLQLFEEGVKLAALCRERLDGAENRIRVLVEDPAGEVKEEDAPELDGLFQRTED